MQITLSFNMTKKESSFGDLISLRIAPETQCFANVLSPWLLVSSFSSVPFALVFRHLVQRSSLLCSFSSGIGRIRIIRHFCGVAVQHSYNMSGLCNSGIWRRNMYHKLTHLYVYPIHIWKIAKLGGYNVPSLVNFQILSQVR